MLDEALFSFFADNKQGKINVEQIDETIGCINLNMVNAV